MRTARNFVTKEQVETAKKVNAVEFFRAYRPEELVEHSASNYRTKTHDSLKIDKRTGEWTWYSHTDPRTGKPLGGRTALSLLTDGEGMPYQDAVRLLVGIGNVRACPFSSQSLSEEPEKRQKDQRVKLPIPAQNRNAVTQYLRSRGVCDAVLQYCYRKGLIYQTAYGDEVKCVFVGRDDAGRPQFGCWRSCTGADRRDCFASKKEFSFRMVPDCEADTVEVYESPIDALSGATMRYIREGERWRSIGFLSLGGVGNHALENYLSRHPQIKVICFRLDADEAGRSGTERLMKLYAEKGYCVVDKPPHAGKDVNEALCIWLESQRKKKNGREWR